MVEGKKFEVTVGPILLQAENEREAIMQWRIMVLENWGIVLDQSKFREVKDGGG